MGASLKKFFVFLVLASIITGLLVHSKHAHFSWEKIPSIDAVFGFIGAFLLIFLKRIISFLSHREEDFYD